MYMKLRASTGKPAPLVVVNTYPKSAPAPVSEWESPPHTNSQPSNSVSSFLPDSNAEVVEEAFSQGAPLLHATFYFSISS